MTLPDNAIVRAPRVTLLARPFFLEPEHLRVAWKGESTDGERLVEFAERLRTVSQENAADRETRAFLRGVASKSHDSALEHATYSLLIEGISLTAAHELRRGASGLTWTELSPRHIDLEDFRFVVPPAIVGSTALETAWGAQMTAALHSYTSLVDDLMTRYAWIGDKMQRRRVARDAASGVMPGSTESRVVLTGSASSWRTLVMQSGAERADLEMRRLALYVLRLLAPEAPSFFDDFDIYLASDRHEATRITPR